MTIYFLYIIIIIIIITLVLYCEYFNIVYVIKVHGWVLYF